MTGPNSRISPRPLSAGDFPKGTPLNAFFAWNEARRRRDRRYTIACDLSYLYRRFKTHEAGLTVCASHIAIRPLIRLRFRSRVLLSSTAVAAAVSLRPDPYDPPALELAQRVVGSLLASIGAADVEKHAAVFKAFEELSHLVDLDALAARRPRLVTRRQSSTPRKILVIKLSALGDFVQALRFLPPTRSPGSRDRPVSLTRSPSIADRRSSTSPAGRRSAVSCAVVASTGFMIFRHLIVRACTFGCSFQPVCPNGPG